MIICMARLASAIEELVSQYPELRQNISTGVLAASTSSNLPIGAEAQVGDRVLVLIVCRGNVLVSCPSGWYMLYRVQHASGYGCAAFWTDLQSSVSTVEVTSSASSEKGYASIILKNGTFDPFAPIQISAFSDSSATRPASPLDLSAGPWLNRKKMILPWVGINSQSVSSSVTSFPYPDNNIALEMSISGTLALCTGETYLPSVSPGIGAVYSPSVFGTSSTVAVVGSPDVPPTPSTAISFIGSTSISQGSSTANSSISQSLPVHANAQVGDLAILIITSFNGLYNPSMPGWEIALSNTATRFIRYRVLTSTSDIVMPPHDSRYLLRLMILRGAGSQPIIESVRSRLVTSGTATESTGAATYSVPGGNNYILEVLYNNAAATSWAVNTYPYSGANTSAISVGPSAYCTIATAGTSWSGGYAPSVNWTFSNASSSSMRTIVIRGNS